MNDSPKPENTWRLIKHLPARGAWNMAVDEAILEAVGRQDVPPTLRLYAWDPPCLSLGYAQAFSEVDIEAIQQHRWDIVRRPTGGRAILHTDELTYSICGPHEDPRLAGSVMESYSRLAQALLAALHLMKIPAEANEAASRPERPGQGGPVCFEVPSYYEIVSGGRKLVGSAQARRKEGVLQHGSLPLIGDLGRITQVLRFSSEADRQRAAQRVHQRAATVEEVLGERVSWQQAAAAFESAFQQTFGLVFLHGDLTPWESDRAAQLVDEKYAHPDWTEKPPTRK